MCARMDWTYDGGYLGRALDAVERQAEADPETDPPDFEPPPVRRPEES